jgi:hypothetical protein
VTRTAPWLVDLDGPSSAVAFEDLYDGERGVGAEEDERGWEPASDGAAAIGAVSRDLHAPLAHPALEHAEQLAGELGLLLVLVPTLRAFLFVAIEPEQDRQRPCTDGERYGHRTATVTQTWPKVKTL